MRDSAPRWRNWDLEIAMDTEEFVHVVLSHRFFLDARFRPEVLPTNNTSVPNFLGRPLLISIDINENFLTIFLILRLMKDRAKDSFDYFLCFVQIRRPDKASKALVSDRWKAQIVVLMRMPPITLFVFWLKGICSEPSPNNSSFLISFGISELEETPLLGRLRDNDLAGKQFGFFLPMS
jgi:hypothetical protein